MSKPGTLDTEIERDATKYSTQVMQSIEAKASKYKWWSRIGSIFSVTLSASVIFFLMFEEVNRYTIAAALITILNSALLAWFQLEKPYDRWKLYRKYHRRLEAMRLRFVNGIEPYNGANPKNLFLADMSDLQLRLHDEWEGLIPNSEQLEKLQKAR